ncbi:MAG: lipocalin family protein [Caulobacter sp.]|nr:lipocalin family protein [Caulobacter sp.]
MTRSPFLALAAGLTIAGAGIIASAWAAAPQPTRPVAPSFYSGRWYEIARIPNAGQRDCQAAYSQFTATAARAFKVSQVCRKGSASGPAKTFNTTGKILPGSGNAKFEMSFFGGVRKQEYWVLDRSADGAWALMATPGGNYIWLMSRKAVMDPAAKAGAVARIRALGYAQKLEYPAQAT